MIPFWPFFAAALALVAGGIAWGLLSRRRAERRARLLELLSLAVRRGLPLAAVVAHFGTEARGRRAKESLAALSARLAVGEPLSSAAGTGPRPALSTAAAAAICAAEGTGRVGPVLDDLAKETGADVALSHRIALTAVYPALHASLLLFVHWRVLEARVPWMTPRGEAPLAETGVALDVVRIALFALLALALLPTAVRRLRGTAPLGQAARLLSLAGTLVHAGLPLGRALALSAPAAGKGRLARRAIDLAACVDAGDPGTAGWDRLGLPRAVSLRLSWAKEGGLPAALSWAGADCRRRQRERADRWLRWLQPASVVAVGLLVAVDYAVLADVWRSAQAQAMPW